MHSPASRRIVSPGESATRRTPEACAVPRPRALLVADVDIGDTAHAPRVGWRAACVHGRDRCVLADVCVRVAIPPMRIMPLMRAA